MRTRREFLSRSAALAAAASVAGPLRPLRGEEPAPLILQPPLPYDEAALAPSISARTVSFHYGKHHRANVDKTNGLVRGTGLEGLDLKALIQASSGKPETRALFENAAQAFNHAFYWNSMKPGGGGKPVGKVAAAIEASFGSYEKFAAEFTGTATALFGSGWTWLVANGPTLGILKTADADTPLLHDRKPLLTIDVWEHAYYLDYQNRRSDYVKAWMESLVNWDFAAANLES
jgi:Fe-Mn family superoxide dismutase